MKKVFILAIMLLISILSVACGNGNSTKATDWAPTPYEAVNNFEGVSMTVKENSVTPTELTLIFENKSDKQAIYGEDFLLEKEINGDWYQVPTIIDEYGFNDIGYELPPSEIGEFTIDWDWLYGSLEAGKYRIVKKILDFREAGNYDEYDLAAQFTID